MNIGVIIMGFVLLGLCVWAIWKMFIFLYGILFLLPISFIQKVLNGTKFMENIKNNFQKHLKYTKEA